MDEHPLRVALVVDPERWAELPSALRVTVLRVFERSPARSAGRDLGRLVATPWFLGLGDDDRLRAAKVVAYVSALQEGARRSEGPLCRRRIIEGTLDAVLAPEAPFSLAFEDLPLEEGRVVAGLRRAGTVVLNRRAITADEGQLGEGTPVERRVGTCTLAHEINHLCNPTPVGPTFEAFMDEYRAWMVDFVVFAGRRPRLGEGLGRCRDVLTRPAYAAVGRLLHEPAERARVRRFLRSFGEAATVEEALARELAPSAEAAPLPQPLGNVDNDPRALAGPPA